MQNLNLEKMQLGIGVPGVNRNDIYTIKIPLPPLEAQEKIISVVEKIESTISLLESHLSQLDSKKSRILQDFL